MRPRSESPLNWKYVKGCGFVDKARAFAIVILPTSPHLQQQRQQYHFKLSLIFSNEKEKLYLHKRARVADHSVKARTRKG